MNLHLQFVLRYLYPKSGNSFSSNASILAIIGLSIGLFSLIITLSIIKGFENVLDEKLSSIDGKVRVKNILGKPISNPEKLDSLLSDIDFPLEIAPYIRGTAMIRVGGNTDGVIIEGVDEIPDQTYFDLKNYTINKDDIIIGKALADEMGISIGDQIIITPLASPIDNAINQKFNLMEVIGFIDSGMQEYDKTIAYTSLDRAREIFEMDNAISGYTINGSEQVENITKVLNDHIRYPYYYETWRERHRIIFDWIKIQRFPIVIIFSLITLVAITNIMAAVSMIIREKNSQIAILISLGMESSDIRKIFYFYGGIIGFLGSFLGFIVSYSFILIQNKYKIIALPEDIYFMDYIPANFDLFVFCGVLVLTLLISIISTVIPSRSIIKQRPTELLAQE
jgi:lipoprotein-releasing system permease protein|tara:strand:+ start:247 stop:1431 length:1185 start_codon:yes stop_codon:yes gene_type:complete